MWSERDTGAREAFMFDMYRNGAVFFGVLSLMSYLLLYYYRTNDR